MSDTMLATPLKHFETRLVLQASEGLDHKPLGFSLQKQFGHIVNLRYQPEMLQQSGKTGSQKPCLSKQNSGLLTILSWQLAFVAPSSRLPCPQVVKARHSFWALPTTASLFQSSLMCPVAFACVLPTVVPEDISL